MLTVVARHRYDTSRLPIPQHLLFPLILVVTTVARVLILFRSQTHVHSDEAIIGLMGKHILEGRYFPFYMYGQPYNAGAAWESYLAAVSFAVFGVGVLPLKSSIVLLSLVCLVVFYGMTSSLYGPRTAVLATLMFALTPSLLKWHFQVRGYSWYFLSIPLLTWLFAVVSRSPARARTVFLFGLVSGLSVWNLELVLSLIAALWILLAARRTLPARHAAVGVIGFIVGYAPAILFNLTHQFSNWKTVGAAKTSSRALFDPSTFVEILFEEMPKFFGPDTTLWYYPETPAMGYVSYAIALAAVVATMFPFLKSPAHSAQALLTCGDVAGSDEGKDSLMLVLTIACFVPYVVAPIRVPGYFLGGCVFLSVLTGRLVERCFAMSAAPGRMLGTAVLAGTVLAGTGAMIEAGSRNEIETLTFGNNGGLYLARFPGADIEAVERHLRRNQIPSLWTTVSFVYPLLFESGETLAVSDAIFGWGRRVYPEAVPRREPRTDQRQVFVIERDSPFRPAVEARCAQAAGAAPLVNEFGTLVVIEERPRP